MSRIAFYGDIGGHADELRDSLIGDLGADPHSLKLPADTYVVQVGDLVHRGPNDDNVLSIVELQLRYGQWVQLVGNHDLLELDEEPLFVFPGCSDSEREHLRWMRDVGYLHAACAVDTADGDILVTHAGLTSDYYRRVLSEPVSAAEAAAKIDRLFQSGDPHDNILLQRHGIMLGGRGMDFRAGPIWAEAGGEVRYSWFGVQEAPFHQVHGHSSPYDWSRKKWTCPPEVIKDSRLDIERRHVATDIGGKTIWGIDPGLGKYAGVTWAPLVLEGTIVYPYLKEKD